MSEGFFEIGVIASAHGIKGDVAVFPTTDNPARFELLKEVTFKGSKEVYPIERVWYHKQFVMLKLKNVNTMTEAEKLKGNKIIIPDSKALPLAADEYYMRDLFGLGVYTVDGEYFGELTDIFQTGANDVYVIKSNDKEILLPAIKECILNVDVINKKMTVKILEGLLEL